MLSVGASIKQLLIDIRKCIEKFQNKSKFTWKMFCLFCPRVFCVFCVVNVSDAHKGGIKGWSIKNNC